MSEALDRLSASLAGGYAVERELATPMASCIGISNRTTYYGLRVRGSRLYFTLGDLQSDIWVSDLEQR